MESKTPEDRREHLRQKELKKNPTGTLNDSINRGESGSLSDVAGGLGWKGTGIGILVLIIGYVLYKLIF
ncbi:DUF6366 family protein [Lysinibacillus sp. 54212]|uniref:DUF6366 family protein n=1 Tax=Lysinibacillus sp. 54212 TaxID=3119829 RepID=UPI002FCA020A